MTQSLINTIILTLVACGVATYFFMRYLQRKHDHFIANILSRTKLPDTETADLFCDVYMNCDECAKDLHRIAQAISVPMGCLRPDDAVFAWGRSRSRIIHYEQQFGVVNELLDELVEDGYPADHVSDIVTIRDYVRCRSGLKRLRT